MKKLFSLITVLAILLCMTTGAITHENPEQSTVSEPMSYQYQGAETDLITLINNERAANGAYPLAINWEVARLARYKSEEMRTHRLFGHESLVYGSLAQILDRFHVPYSAVGANIAKGQETAGEVMDAWRGSPGHHANLINQSFTSAGVGLSWDEYGIPYWTLILIAD